MHLTCYQSYSELTYESDAKGKINRQFAKGGTHWLRPVSMHLNIKAKLKLNFWWLVTRKKIIRKND